MSVCCQDGVVGWTVSSITLPWKPSFGGGNAYSDLLGRPDKGPAVPTRGRQWPGAGRRTTWCQSKHCNGRFAVGTQEVACRRRERQRNRFPQATAEGL